MLEVIVSNPVINHDNNQIMKALIDLYQMIDTYGFQQVSFD